MNNNVTLKTDNIELGDQSTFTIDENNVDGELCQVGSELCFYGNLAAELKAQAASKKLELDAHDSELALQIRSMESDKRVTEGFVKETIKKNVKHKELTEELIQAERDLLKVENLFKAQQKRADCIIALAYKQRTEIKNY
jgi:hypothetical protein